MFSSQSVIAAVVVAILTGVVAPAAQATGWQGRADIYSTEAVNNICGEAQRIVTSSDLDPSNVVYAKWDGFVQSDAAPYSVIGGNVPLTYSPPEEPDLPLRSTQHLFYDSYRFGPGSYPTVVSCKMKNAEYLNARDPDLAAIDQPCKAVNAQNIAEVMANLPRWQLWFVRSVVLDDDVTFDRGSDWTAEFPDNPYPVIYREYPGGPLHIKSSALYVAPHPDNILVGPSQTFIDFCNFTGGDQGFLGSACEPRKWGVRYCHLPSPEYIRAALTGRVKVPTCGTPTADPRVCD
ncbi:MAG: hypothetical protein QNJ73_15720 [Gammaproteobacteria bacterium]|nr:hypothetical protein [Gammaproteobacteria bacterium]